MDADEVAAAVARRLGAIDGVVAVALGGSRGRGDADGRSDVDLGLYYDPDRRPPLDALRALARELDDRHPEDAVTDFGGWGPWINGGAWLAVNGVRVDWLYRDLAQVERVIAECQAGRPTSHYQPGYPHGFHSHYYLAEVHYGRALVDRGGAFAALQARTRPYPPRLREALLRHHLWEAGFAVENAVKPAARGDTMFVTGCLHRGAACLLQAVFALNRRYLLHEKRALQIAATLERLPEGFAATLAGVLAAPGATPGALGKQVERMEALVASTRALCATAAV
jgi:hypothetical protein